MTGQEWTKKFYAHLNRLHAVYHKREPLECGEEEDECRRVRWLVEQAARAMHVRAVGDAVAAIQALESNALAAVTKEAIRHAYGPQPPMAVED